MSSEYPGTDPGQGGGPEKGGTDLQFKSGSSEVKALAHYCKPSNNRGRRASTTGSKNHVATRTTLAPSRATVSLAWCVVKLGFGRRSSCKDRRGRVIFFMSKGQIRRSTTTGSKKKPRPGEGRCGRAEPDRGTSIRVGRKYTTDRGSLAVWKDGCVSSGQDEGFLLPGAVPAKGVRAGAWGARLADPAADNPGLQR